MTQYLHFKLSTIINVLTLVAVSLPLFAYAQSSFVPCQGVILGGSGPTPDCNACHLVGMGNSILIWLIGVMFAIFAVIIFAAGWGLMTSGGSPDAKTAAKSKLTNAFIGLIIVLAAWIIVDTVMRGLVVGDGNLGAQYTGFGPWSEIQCVDQSAYASRVVAISPESAATQGLDTFGSVGDYGSTTAGLGTGNDAIVDFAEMMDALNCRYSQPNRNACRGNPAYTDCSDLVNAAYQAAGCSSPGTYTGNMITNATPFSSQSELRAGDAMIHRTGGAGHVVICMDNGCNQVIHAAGTSPGIIVSNGSTYANDPRYTTAVRAADFCP